MASESNVCGPSLNIAQGGFNDAGYALLEGGLQETYGNFGHEIVATFLGPCVNKGLFLDTIFGRWEKDLSDPCPWVCCPPPCPVVNGGQQDPLCFMPDSYRISPTCGNPTELVEFTQPSPGDQCQIPGCFLSLSGGECCSIEVSYRSFDPGPFTLQGDPNDCNVCAGGTIPVIYPCTLLDVRTSREFSVVNTPGARWQSSHDPNKKLSGAAGIPIHVLVTKYDVVWSNVPEVNVFYLEAMSGRVNADEFLGYPKEAVLFIFRDHVRKSRWNCEPTYDVRMQFVAKTTQTFCEMPHFDDPMDPDPCTLCGRLGLWNRAWFSDTTSLCDFDPTPPATCTEEQRECQTHWHPIREVDCAECKNESPPFLLGNFADIFLCGVCACVDMDGLDVRPACNITPQEPEPPEPDPP